MKFNLKYIFLFFVCLIFGYNLFGQTNEKTSSNFILSSYRIENTPSLSLKENSPKIINNKNIFVNSQKIEKNSVLNKSTSYLGIKVLDHNLETTKSHLYSEQNLKAKKQTHDFIEMKSSKFITINYPKVSIKKE
jgi:hypothetical protein